MSGGSFDYAFSEMEVGDAERFSRHVDGMVGRLTETLAALRSGEVTAWRAGERVTYPRAEAAGVAVAAAIDRFKLAQSKLREVGDLLRELAPIAKSIEWSCSGDTGRDDEADRCVEWMLRKLGLRG